MTCLVLGRISGFAHGHVVGEGDEVDRVGKVVTILLSDIQLDTEVLELAQVVTRVVPTAVDITKGKVIAALIQRLEGILRIRR